MIDVPLRYALVQLLQVHRRNATLTILWLGAHLRLALCVKSAFISALAHVATIVSSVALTRSCELLFAS